MVKLCNLHFSQYHSKAIHRFGSENGEGFLEPVGIMKCPGWHQNCSLCNLLHSWDTYH